MAGNQSRGQGGGGVLKQGSLMQCWKGKKCRVRQTKQVGITTPKLDLGLRADAMNWNGWQIC